MTTGDDGTATLEQHRQPQCETPGCSEVATHDDQGFWLSGQPYFSAHCEEHAKLMQEAAQPERCPECGKPL